MSEFISTLASKDTLYS